MRSTVSPSPSPKRVALHDVPVSKDVLVSTPEEFERCKDLVGTMEMTAAREGKVLYARAR